MREGAYAELAERLTLEWRFRGDSVTGQIAWCDRGGAGHGIGEFINVRLDAARRDDSGRCVAG